MDERTAVRDRMNRKFARRSESPAGAVATRMKAIAPYLSSSTCIAAELRLVPSTGGSRRCGSVVRHCAGCSEVSGFVQQAAAVMYYPGLPR
jgi:hypothetical protein